ncbi:hypothetical protein D3C87_845090 [compost metagenome]
MVRATLLGSRVVAKLEEGLDVRVPRLDVDGGGAFALPTLVDRMDRRVEHLEEGNETAAHAVVAPDDRARATDGRPVDADAARPLREAGAVRIGLVDAFEGVLSDRQQVAGGHLGMARARVEERGRSGHVAELADQLVEGDRLRDGLGEAQGHPHEKPLRPLDDEAGFGMAQQVAIVDGLEAEVLEGSIARMGDRRLEGLPIGLGELPHLRVQQTERLGLAQVLGEGLAQADFLSHVSGEETSRHPRVLRLLGDQHDGGRDRALVEVSRGASLVQARDGLRGDRDGVHPRQALAGPRGGLEDLLETNVLARPVSLDYLHSLILSYVPPVRASRRRRSVACARTSAMPSSAAFGKRPKPIPRLTSRPITSAPRAAA